MNMVSTCYSLPTSLDLREICSPAGLNTKAVIEPTTPASKYPIPDFNDDNDDNKEGVSDSYGLRVCQLTFSRQAEGSNPATEDVDEDGEAIVKTKALIKPSSRSKKSTPTEDNNDDDRLPNGNYKCRHTCEGACRHTCW